MAGCPPTRPGICSQPPNRFPTLTPQAEQKLVDIVEGLSVKDTAKVVEYWRQAVDGPGELDLETQFAR
jgi:hypothetical protein